MKKYSRKYRYRRHNRVSKILGTKDLIDRSKKKYHNTYTYNRTRFTNSNNRVIVRCRIHGEFTIKPKQLLARRGGCPKCKLLSNGEIRTTLFLIDNKIEYKPEHMLPGYTWRYDFYLPKLGILIEYDGIQHFKAVRKFGGRRTLKSGIQRDKDKDTLAELHGLSMIRIPYTKYDVLEDYLLYKISRVFKYRIGKKFYKTFGNLCDDKKLPGDTKPSNVKKYLTYVTTLNNLDII